MELLVFGLAACLVGGTVVVRRARAARGQRRERAEELAVVRRVADEDVICFGEDLQRFGTQYPAQQLDDIAAADLQTALQAYEAAQRVVDGLETVEHVTRVVDTLTDGRFALASAAARVEGRPAPTRRTPCFFNPQHGPAVKDVQWNQPGRGTRIVPVCAQDAARAQAGERVDVRKVQIGGIRVPYWEAGELLLPYVKGYFPARPEDIRLDATAVWAAPFDTPLPNADDQFKKWSP